MRTGCPRRLKASALILASWYVLSCGAAAESPAPYLRDLQSANPFVRQAAARWLGDTKERLAVAPLSGLLSPDQPEDVRVAAIAALGKIGDPAAIPHLVSQLKSDSCRIRMAAAEALGTIRDKQAVAPLIALIRSAPDPAGEDVLVSIWALGNIGDRDAIHLLLSLRTSSNKYVAYNAGQALKKLGP
jgi:HEAT repeat protein